MITKSDWEAVQEKLIEADRRSLGAPPTAEELLAYSRGELDGDEAERMREMLVAYPEWARALTEPFADDVRPGEPGYVPDEEIDRQWRRLQEQVAVPVQAQRKETTGGRVLAFWQAATAIAASIALAFGGWSAHLGRQLGQPQVITHKEMLQKDERSRGLPAGPTTVVPGDDPLELLLPLTDERQLPGYRLELVDAGSAKTLWSRSVAPDSDDTFSIVVPRRYFAPGGEYKLVLYGSNGRQEEQLSTFTIQVAK